MKIVISRNGLHCLAEVSLSLPLSDAISQHFRAQDKSVPSKQREKHLNQLLAAGVDPGNHDMRGLTQFMAFVLYTREGEDDEITARFLWRLHDAGS